MTTNTGGQAFPTSEERFSNGTLNQEAQPGMTLRDYFAAKAMEWARLNANLISLEQKAKYAYEVADAMLKAREA
jgi:hypothetical protein